MGSASCRLQSTVLLSTDLLVSPWEQWEGRSVAVCERLWFWEALETFQRALRKVLHVIIEICVSYSARMFIVLLDPSAEGI